MDRKDFWSRYTNDPEGAWRDLAETEKDLEAKDLYLSFAVAERERLSASAKWAKEDGPLQTANELMKLAHNGPTPWERASWSFNAMATSIGSALSRMSATLKRAAETLNEFVRHWGELIMLVFIALVWWQTFGGLACIIVVVLGLASIIATAIPSSKGYSFPSWVLILLWAGALATSIGWKGFISTPITFVDDDAFHAAYVLRDGEIKDVRIFSVSEMQEDVRVKTIRARVPLRDDLERVYFKFTPFNIEVFSSTQPGRQTVYTATGRYHIEPRRPPEGYDLSPSSLDQEKVGFETLATLWIKNEAQRWADELENGTTTEKKPLPTHPLFNLIVDDISVKETGKRVLLEDVWYRAIPDTQ